MHPLLNVAFQAARQAGRTIVRSLDKLDTLTIDKKGRHDFVTQIDRLAEEIIVQTIQKSYPQHGILSEESGSIQEHPEYCWIIDPLDGTTNFIHGFPQFAISIALKKNDRLEVGLVYDPLKDELFTAVRGQGAQLNNRRIRVSKCTHLDDALIGTGFPFRHDNVAPYLDTLREILPTVAGVRRAGAAALDLAYVAAGRLDGFWEFGLQLWDMAAGILLITEAGGFVSEPNGGTNYLESGNLLTGNAKIYKLLLDLIKPTLPKAEIVA